jgi:hypothetical protein
MRDHVNGLPKLTPAATRSYESAKGIPAVEIKPRENVFTFDAWKALGRIVRRGEHGVKIETWIEHEKRDPENPDAPSRLIRTFRRTTVFHISQTELIDKASL